jgi:hypothetical protein
LTDVWIILLWCIPLFIDDWQGDEKQLKLAFQKSIPISQLSSGVLAFVIPLRILCLAEFNRWR